MLKKIVNKIKSFFYAIPFALKAGDEMISTSNQSSGSESTIQQQKNQHNVYADLLNGVVTQEVEELRWEMYKVEELANDYIYIGNGRAKKIKLSDEERIGRRLKFTQFNKDLEYNFKESLNMGPEIIDCPTRKLFSCVYDNPCVRYKLENNCEKITVNLKDGISTKFYFINDNSIKKRIPFINHLKKIRKDLKSIDVNEKKKIKAYIDREEILTSLKELKFTTFQASNNVPNGITYRFTNPRIESIDEKGGYIILEFIWEKYDGGQLLSEKFYSETADKKFKNKEKKEGFAPTIAFNAP